MYDKDAEYFAEAKHKFMDELGFEVTNKDFILFLMKRHREDDPNHITNLIIKLDKAKSKDSSQGSDK